ncbi:recombinase [Clostridia bacterium]|nr:recombinase [Clostridia bacterium]
MANAQQQNLSAASVQNCREEQIMNAISNKLSVLYCRLSRDDNDGDRESNSIQNQKKILVEYAERNGFTPYVIEQDDGKTGTNYARPGWQSLMARVENDEVSTILVKNLDRMGRNYLESGMLREMFAERGVRLIAVNDGVDTAKGEGDDFLPFREIMAEWYARDCSRKVRAVYRSKGLDGKHTGSHALYGYKKSEIDKGKWEIDETAAAIVRRVFAMTIDGFGPGTIATKLAEEKIECPSYYLAQRGCGNYQNRPQDDPYRWWNTTVSDIISRLEYCGYTVNFKTTQKSFKNKRRYANSPENMAVFENTHEPIVPQETWELANKLRANAKRHVDYCGDPRPLTGLLFCADCGAKLYHERSTPNAVKLKDAYLCASYVKKTAECTPHRVTTAAITELILDTLRTVAGYALNNEEDFRARVSEMFSAKLDGDMKARRKRLAVCEKRVADLDRLIKKLFEEHALGDLADKRFAALSADYEQEQADLEHEVETLNAEIGSYVDSAERADSFMSLTRKYIDFSELSPSMLNEFVERVNIGEREDRGCQFTKQKVEIVLNFIGDFDLPIVADPDGHSCNGAENR